MHIKFKLPFVKINIKYYILNINIKLYIKYKYEILSATEELKKARYFVALKIRQFRLK